MKSNLRIIGIVLFLGLFSISAMAMKTASFKVYGNCDLCKDRIEKATKEIKGVSDAKWDEKTQMLKVSFNESKTDLVKINKAIAATGHDTDTCKASDKAYNDLKDCCHYKRPKPKAKTECIEKKKGKCCNH